MLSFLIRRDPIKFLGRWNVDYCQNILNTKVRFANEDHCGTCHYATIEQTLRTRKQFTKSVEELKMKTDSIRRYNEYINVAVQSRRRMNAAPINSKDVDRQIDYFICMN